MSQCYKKGARIFGFDVQEKVVPDLQELGGGGAAFRDGDILQPLGPRFLSKTSRVFVAMPSVLCMFSLYRITFLSWTRDKVSTLKEHERAFLESTKRAESVTDRLIRRTDKTRGTSFLFFLSTRFF